MYILKVYIIFLQKNEESHPGNSLSNLWWNVHWIDIFDVEWQVKCDLFTHDDDDESCTF